MKRPHNHSKASLCSCDSSFLVLRPLNGPLASRKEGGREEGRRGEREREREKKKNGKERTRSSLIIVDLGGESRLALGTADNFHRRRSKSWPSIGKSLFTSSCYRKFLAGRSRKGTTRDLCVPVSSLCHLSPILSLRERALSLVHADNLRVSSIYNSSLTLTPLKF